MSIIIRFGYCPSNPGPKAKIKNKWYTDISQAIDEYDGKSEIWIKYNNSRYRKISYDKLTTLYYVTDKTRSI